MPWRVPLKPVTNATHAKHHRVPISSTICIISQPQGPRCVAFDMSHTTSLCSNCRRTTLLVGRNPHEQHALYSYIPLRSVIWRRFSIASVVFCFFLKPRLNRLKQKRWIRFFCLDKSASLFDFLLNIFPSRYPPLGVATTRLNKHWISEPWTFRYDKVTIYSILVTITIIIVSKQKKKKHVDNDNENLIEGKTRRTRPHRSPPSHSRNTF